MDRSHKIGVFSSKLSYGFQNFLNLRNTTQKTKISILKDHAD